MDSETGFFSCGCANGSTGPCTDADVAMTNLLCGLNEKARPKGQADDGI
jgi:hypothetical protein